MKNSLLWPPAEYIHGNMKIVLKDGHSTYYVIIDGKDYEVCKEVFDYIERINGGNNE